MNFKKMCSLSEQGTNHILQMSHNNSGKQSYTEPERPPERRHKGTQLKHQVINRDNHEIAGDCQSHVERNSDHLSKIQSVGQSVNHPCSAEQHVEAKSSEANVDLQCEELLVSV